MRFLFVLQHANNKNVQAIKTAVETILYDRVYLCRLTIGIKNESLIVRFEIRCDVHAYYIRYAHAHAHLLIKWGMLGNVYIQLRLVVSMDTRCL